MGRRGAIFMLESVRGLGLGIGSGAVEEGVDVEGMKGWRG